MSEVTMYEAPAAAPVDRIANTLKALGGTSNFATTVTGTDEGTRRHLAKASLNSQPLQDNLNTPIAAVDFIFTRTEIADEKTGVVDEAVRVTIIDVNGSAFHATSGPLVRDITNVLGIMPATSDWSEPLALVVTREGKGSSQYFKLGLA